jgi:regulation of enolase protein 1 (concanavalin A-like superfamily)
MDGQIDPNATKPWPRYGQKTKNEESFWNRTSFYGFFIHSRQEQANRSDLNLAVSTKIIR